MRIGLVFDGRAPHFGVPAERIYREAVEQARYADEAGFELMTVSEHHGSEDGYLPSPVTMTAVFAGATARMRLRLSALLLPLYHPIRVAEDLAVLDLASGGRLEVVVGGGYRPEEFAMLGVDPATRGRRVEEGVALLRQAWRGEPLQVGDASFRVTPRPAREGGPPLLLGGSTPVAARRAARIADGFLPTAASLRVPYEEECVRLGKDLSGYEHRSAPMFVHVAHDPDAAWERIAPFALHETNSYAAWTAAVVAAPYDPVDDATALRASGNYVVVTPDECLEVMRELAGVGEAAFYLKPLMGGMDPDLGWESLELFAREVLPRWRAGTAGG